MLHITNSWLGANASYRILKQWCQNFGFNQPKPSELRTAQIAILFDPVQGRTSTNPSMPPPKKPPRDLVQNSMSQMETSGKPFAAGEDTTSWLEEASTPMGDSSSQLSSISSLYDAPQEFGQSQADLSGNKLFDEVVEKEIAKFDAALSSGEDASERPFAAGDESPGWLEAVSTPVSANIVDSAADQSALEVMSPSHKL